MVRKVIVAPGEIIVLVKGRKVTRVLESGTHFVFGNGTLYRYKLSSLFQPMEMELKTALSNEILANMLEVTEIGQNELGILSENGRILSVLEPQAVAIWKSEYAPLLSVVNRAEAESLAEVPAEWTDKPAMANYVRKLSVLHGEVGLLYMNGEYVRTLRPGTYKYWKNDQEIVLRNVSSRIEAVNLSGQELLTRDKAAVRINFSMNCRVVNPKLMVDSIRDFNEYMYKLVAMSIREVIGGITLESLLSTRENATDSIMNSVGEAARAVGVEVLNGGVVDVILPGDVKEILNKVLIAEKDSQANVIRRREEMAAIRNSLNSAKLMEENPILFKLKELELIERISERVATLNLNGSGEILSQLKGLISPAK